MASAATLTRNQRTILVTPADRIRLTHMIDSAKLFHHDYGYIASLDRDLENARVVEQGQMPADIVAINSQVHVIDVRSRKKSVYIVVFPKDANYCESRISVLAPIGAALLGRSIGDVVEIKTPGGIRRLRITAIGSRELGEANLAAA